MFERLRAAVNAALDAAMPAPDWHDLRAQMHRAAVEGRAAIQGLRDGIAQTERALEEERRLLEDARRRGRLADGIQDAETVEVAQRFERKHGDRVAVLEQKYSAQCAELALAERDVEEMVAQLKELERRGPAADRVSRGSAVADGLEGDDGNLGRELDRAGREADADARLRELKKRMGK